MGSHVHIRLLNESDPVIISAAFLKIGWGKPVSQYQRYLAEQGAGARLCLVAMVDAGFAGYVTVNWQPVYAPLAAQKIPEIQDLNVIPCFRRQGIATCLMDRAEKEAVARSKFVGIAVGLHPGYNAAQRLYIKRGYIPDGHGVTYRDRYVEEGAQVVLDDDFVLHLTKEIARE